MSAQVLISLYSPYSDLKWYETQSPPSPSSPVEQHVYYPEAAVTGHHYHHHAASGRGMSSPATSPGSYPSAIYDLNPQDINLVEDRTVGLTAYPSASQYHRTKRHHSEYSSSLPPYHPINSSGQLQHHHHHHYHPQEHHRVNSDSGKDRYRMMSSPETQMRHPIGGVYSGTTNSSHAYSKVVPTKRWNSASGGGERGSKQIHRRHSENYAERQASVGAQVGVRRGNFSRRTIVAQPKSESSLRYNSPELGLVYPMGGVAEASPGQLQIGREMPHQIPPSGSEMRVFLFEKMDRSNGHRDVHDLSGGNYSPLGYGSGDQHQQNADEQRYANIMCNSINTVCRLC